MVREDDTGGSGTSGRLLLVAGLVFFLVFLAPIPLVKLYNAIPGSSSGALATGARAVLKIVATPYKAGYEHVSVYASYIDWIDP